MSGKSAASYTFDARSIGMIHADEAAGEYALEILLPFRPALKQLDQFSHVMVIWWAALCDDEENRSLTQVCPPYAEEHLTGIFATRSPARPNPIGVTTCRILSVDEQTGVVRVAYIDAMDTTPILDLKAYFPTSDRVKAPHIPEWLSGWPEWMPEEIWEPG
jgi:tRNA-Thr(GGU) m(6)t(6)A37 methyltransferase TsaA